MYQTPKTAAILPIRAKGTTAGNKITSMREKKRRTVVEYKLYSDGFKPNKDLR